VFLKFFSFLMLGICGLVNGLVVSMSRFVVSLRFVVVID